MTIDSVYTIQVGAPLIIDRYYWRKVFLGTIATIGFGVFLFGLARYYGKSFKFHQAAHTYNNFNQRFINNDLEAFSQNVLHRPQLVNSFSHIYLFYDSLVRTV